MSMMRNTLLAVTLAASLFGCSSATLVESWKDPETTSLQLGKTIVICPSTNPGIRQPAENGLAAKIPGAVASYTVLSGTALDSRENAQAELKARGYDSAVVVRVLAVNRSVQALPTGAPSRLADQFGLTYYGSGVAVQEGLDVNLETALYRVADGKLIWRGRTNSDNPRNISKMIAAAADASAADLRKQGLLQ